MSSRHQRERTMKVLAAMSGGVDSSVAAALLVEAGHDVVGVTLEEWEGSGRSGSGHCGTDGGVSARAVADELGVPHHRLDAGSEFFEAVVEPFGLEYLAGRTPNPCIECNRRIRFGVLLERASELGCEALATGHHARVDADGGRYRLRRGRDVDKDQSYVLYTLGQEELGRALFPVGEMTKEAVRERARSLGLSSAERPESQDICFVGYGDYRRFLELHFPEVARPGSIVDGDGTVLAQHQGIAGFTVGQRRGLGIAVGEPRYVVGIDAAASTVVVGPRSDLVAAGCRLEGVVFTSGRPPHRRRVDVQVRYRSPAVPAQLEGGAEGWAVRFDEGQAAIAPGQAAVLYRGDEVIGGGIIVESIRR
jgi:tRNA-specific 2-thiouridylase